MAKETEAEKTKKEVLTCGLIMPISSLDGCSSDHWNDVKSIVTESIEEISEPKFRVRLVSDADEIGVIQKRIVQNLYSSDIVVCDVSGKNPNVMFELGMRLAFDKPTVILKDDKTEYSFDTGIIEHIPYRRDLRFGRIVSFKVALVEKVCATHKNSKSDPSSSTFLKNFGKFQVANLNETVLPADKLTVELLKEVQEDMQRLRREIGGSRGRRSPVEGAARIAACIARHLDKNPAVRPSDLVGNREFYSELERLASAPRYYSGPSDFYAAVEDVLKGWAPPEDVG